jgi:hypothetical protein
MNIKTLVIGFIPLEDTTGKNSREHCANQYFRDLLSDFDLGEVYFVEQGEYRKSLDKLNPFVVIVFDEFIAQEVKGYKKDVFLYVTIPPRSIFYRKAEVESKQEKQKETFEEIAWLVQKIREDGEEKEGILRKTASAGYQETYDMITQALIGKDPDLSKKAWDLLNTNDGHPNLIWMRVQLICDVWEYSDGDGREKFLCMAMDQHIESGAARQLEDFTDNDGQVYHQYMFLYLDGYDANYIRRIPVGYKGQDKYEYDALLTKYGTPTGPQMMMEAGQVRKMRTDKQES